jgi:hypothetical protein
MRCNRKGIGSGGSHSFLREIRPLLVYRTFKAVIRAAAQEKYRKRLMEEDGVVVMRRKDLSAV